MLVSHAAHQTSYDLLHDLKKKKKTFAVSADYKCNSLLPPSKKKRKIQIVYVYPSHVCTSTVLIMILVWITKFIYWIHVEPHSISFCVPKCIKPSNL